MKTHTHTHKEHIIDLVHYTKEDGSGNKNLKLAFCAKNLILFVCATFIAFSVTPDT